MGSILNLNERKITCRRSVKDVTALAKELVMIDDLKLHELLHYFDSQHDFESLHILLLASSINKTSVDTKILIKALLNVKRPLDVAPSFAKKGPDVIPDLLCLIANKKIAFARQLNAADIAVDLSLLHKERYDEVMERLIFFKKLTVPGYQLSIITAIIKRFEQQKDKRIPKIVCISLLVKDLLPQDAPFSITGGDYTVRRTVQKIGRNEPCHCGSEKKYKKCCYSDDQVLLRDASHHEGVTKTELKANPSMVNDAFIIEKMGAAELKNLNIDQLQVVQLYSAYKAFHRYELFEKALLCLLKLKVADGPILKDVKFTEPSFEGFEYLEPAKRNALNGILFQQLLDSVLETKDKTLLQSIINNCDVADFDKSGQMQLKVDLALRNENFSSLERACLESIKNPKDVHVHPDFSLTIAESALKSFPAISILLARASLPTTIENPYYREKALSVIKQARKSIGVDPFSDPSEMLCNYVCDSEHKNSSLLDTPESDHFSDQLNAANKEIIKIRRQLNEVNQQLLKKNLNDEKIKPVELVNSKPQTHEDHKLVNDLQHKVSNLKGIISEHNLERESLRKSLRLKQREILKLKDNMENLTVADEQLDVYSDSDDLIDDVILEPTGNIVLPEYSNQFTKSSKDFPQIIYAKAISMVGRLASHDKAVWQNTKPIKVLKDFYRIKLNTDYRLMLSWVPGEKLKVLEIIPRQELEHWIKKNL